MPIRILLVDDHKIMRAGLRLVLEKQTDFEIAAEAGTGKQAIDIAQEVQPDIVIMDVAMPDMNGIEATLQIRKLLPATRVIALTMHSDKNYLTGMLRAGTVGYLLKDCASEELVQAVRDVMAGKAYLSSEIAPMILEDYCGKPEAPVGDSVLTAKEKEILQLLASGMPPREIAVQMQVSAKTIDRYRTQIMEKLKLFSVAELTKYAVRTGISPLT